VSDEIGPDRRLGPPEPPWAEDRDGDELDDRAATSRQKGMGGDHSGTDPRAASSDHEDTASGSTGAAAGEAWSGLVELHERAEAIAHIGGWRLDFATGRFRLTDETFRIYGRPPSGEVELAELLDWVHPADRERLRDGLEPAGGAERYESEHRIARPDGTVRWVLATADLLRGEDGTAMALVGSLRDVTEQRRAEEQRSRLARQLLRAQEEERSQIAVELHDNALQILIAMSMQLELLAGRVEGDEGVQSVVDTLSELAASAIVALRSLLFELHPPALQVGGLLESLEEYARRLASPRAPALNLATTLEEEPTQDEATVLFQIAREALANAYKHASADVVSVSLAARDGGIEVVVRDDGAGFDPGSVSELPGHLGFASIRERAESVGGRVEITSAPGHGTSVRAWIPRL
jgi:signal transduction histidine kinase